MSIIALWFWFVGLPNIHSLAGPFGFFTFISCIGLIISSVLLAVFISENDEKLVEQTRPIRKAFAICALTFFIVTTLASLLPNEKQAMVLAGGYYAINNEEISKLPTNVAKAANAFMEKYTEENSEEPKKD